MELSHAHRLDAASRVDNAHLPASPSLGGSNHPQRPTRIPRLEPARPDHLPVTANRDGTGRARLEPARPTGKASQFVAADEEGDSTFFLLVRGEEVGGFHDGDLLAVSVVADAEPGDLVVWWYGTSRTQALARVADDLSLRPVPGFPSPRNTAPCVDGIGPPSAIRGVVVGFLRRMES